MDIFKVGSNLCFHTNQTINLINKKTGRVEKACSLPVKNEDLIITGMELIHKTWYMLLF